MKSEKPPESSAFDSLWDSLNPDDDDLPPALNPSWQGKVVRAPEERATVAPPMPASEYVRTMMERGELDDPLGTPSPGPGHEGRKVPGLVLAPESEFDREPRAAFSPKGDKPRAPSRPSRLPTPRAPSAPPPSSEPDVETVELLDALHALDGLSSRDALDTLSSRDMLEGLGSLDTIDSMSFEELDLDPDQGEPISSGPQPTAEPAWDIPAVLLGRAPDEIPAQPVSEPAPVSLADRAREMQALFDARNYSNALVLAESVLASDPSHARAQRCAESCRDVLGKKYLSRLGGRENVPRVVMGPEEMHELSLDHRAGFLLSFIDGSMSVDEVLDVSSMPELDALRIMFELRMQGVIEIAEPNRRPGRR